MKARFNDRIWARELRERGYSFSEIMELIPNLSKGTLNGWLKDIELSSEQQKRLLLKAKDGADRGRLKGALSNRQKRIDVTNQIIQAAIKEAKQKSSEPYFTNGVMLYWAEGDKTQERVGFTNADPLMIKFMMKWFREICETPNEKFRIFLSIMSLHNQNEAEKYWSEVTDIPLNQFGKTRIKPTTLKGKRKPSYNGTCRIVISDKNLFRKINGWRSGLLEAYYLPS